MKSTSTVVKEPAQHLSTLTMIESRNIGSMHYPDRSETQSQGRWLLTNERSTWRYKLNYEKNIRVQRLKLSEEEKKNRLRAESYMKKRRQGEGRPWQMTGGNRKQSCAGQFPPVLPAMWEPRRWRASQRLAISSGITNSQHFQQHASINRVL